MTNRTFKAHSSLGEQLQFRSMVGNEQISRLFEFRVRLIVASRTIIWSLEKQMRMGVMPVFHGLHGRFALER